MHHKYVWRPELHFRQQAPQDDRTTTLDTNDLISAVLANVAGPALVTRTFIPLIEQGDRKVIANVSSALASIGADWGRQHTTYSISKYGLNMLVCIIPNDLR